MPVRDPISSTEFDSLIAAIAAVLPEHVRIGDAALFLGNCHAVLDLLRGKIDALVADPPYGIGYVHGAGGGAKFAGVPIAGDDKPFDPAPLIGLAPATCLWGANHFATRLPDSSGWLVWDKRMGKFRNHQSDVELAWTDRKVAARIKNLLWSGAARGSERGEHHHPTQKSLQIMMWCLQELAVPAGGVVLDPYMGSGTTGLACLRTGRRFIGIEVERRWYEAAIGRLERQQAQGTLSL